MTLAGRAVASRRLSSVAAASTPTTELSQTSLGQVEPPPKSIYSIKTKGFDMKNAGAAVRQVGTTRRVFLLDPYLTTNEIEGLAYRLRVMSKNQGINSVLIATDDDDDVEFSAIPSSARESEQLYVPVVDMPELGSNAVKDDCHIWHVAGGYNPRDLFQSGDYKDPSAIQKLMDGMQNLALATRGDVSSTRIPIITLPHGLVNDGGYALCMGSYMLASPDTCFAILNPSRGLAFDPIGLSFILPRLGQEFEQPVVQYPGAGMILALTGMHANAEDMMETGLATNYIESVSTLGTLERTLGNLLPWNQQAILKEPPRNHGAPRPKEDVNAAYRNVGVAGVINAFTAYQAAGGEMWGTHEENYMPGEDPSLELDPIPWQDDRESDLVNFAATFDEIFRREGTLGGLLERFREVASRKTNDKEEQEGIDVAKDIVKRIQSRSPLALSAVFRLMQLGSREGETLESCMAREKGVQAKLFAAGDFEAWGNHALKYKQSQEPPFGGWKHKSVMDVTKDEVDELLSTMD
jgi:enoyl-CoA hydratase/carnithine racemase